ncbi:hypothetical protein TNCV_180881 [Trichonephila clavipes]|nr:hypothetical protein TNCV_180881 [Trichonephila clavipes]
MTSELALFSPNFHTTPMGGLLSLDTFNVHPPLHGRLFERREESGVSDPKRKSVHSKIHCIETRDVFWHSEYVGLPELRGMVRKKKKRYFNLEKKPFLPPNDISIFAKEVSQFAMNERNNVLMAKKKKEKRESPIPVKTDVASFRQKKIYILLQRMVL